MFLNWASFPQGRESVWGEVGVRADQGMGWGEVGVGGKSFLFFREVKLSIAMPYRTFALYFLKLPWFWSLRGESGPCHIYPPPPAFKKRF